MKKIFVSAYACEPGLGSEIGVGWHWVLEMSRYFELWVLTRESNRRTIEPWIVEHPEYANIHWVYYDLPQWARRWKRGMRGVRIYYMLWQRLTDKIVKRTMQENGIDTYHLLTYGNAMWRASRYGMKQRFVWGPVSAGVSLPREFTKSFSWKSRLKEEAQRVMRWLLPLNVGFRRRCRNADLILCKTDDTIRCVPKKWREKCVQMTDVAVEPRDVTQYLLPKRYDDTKINYVAAGTLVGWRTMDVLLESWKLCQQTTVNRQWPTVNSQFSIHNSQLTIVGDGPERERLERLVDELGVRDSVRFVGQVDMETYYSYIAQADVVVNPCFREGAVTVSFDSMAMGKPLICFDTGGYTHYFKLEYSRVISGVKSRAEAVKRLSEAMAELADKELVARMGAEAKRNSALYDWAHKGEMICGELRIEN